MYLYSVEQSLTNELCFFFFLVNAEQVALAREDINSLEIDLASLNNLISGLVSFLNFIMFEGIYI